MSLSQLAFHLFYASFSMELVCHFLLGSVHHVVFLFMRDISPSEETILQLGKTYFVYLYVVMLLLACVQMSHISFALEMSLHRLGCG